MEARWILRPLPREDVVARLQRAFDDLPAALVRVLALRGIETPEQARRFFRPSLDHLHDPFLMADMDAASARLARAITHRERVLVYGDYDIDGTTSAALMTTFLRAMGTPVAFFIPDRLADGYGLGRTGIDRAVDVGAGLIVALDCGITAHAEAQYARACGLDLIICDHHTPLATVPDAVAVLDPKRADCPYPYDGLSGCGVGFKLVQATLTALSRSPEEAFAYLDLVGVSTAGDIVPLTGENRALMAAGLHALRTRPRLGLRKLAERAGVDLRRCTTSQVVFGLGPRINAAGRLGDACRAVELLLASDDGYADSLADELEAVNRQRRNLDQDTAEEAADLTERQLSEGPRQGLVLHHRGWHLGIIGIVASRIAERYSRPTILLTTVNGLLKGSARSVRGVNIYGAIASCQDLLEAFGGHDYAAGLSLRPENLPAFRERFDAAAGAALPAGPPRPIIDVDALLPFEDVTARFWSLLRLFEPFGPENDEPVFLMRDLVPAAMPRTVGREGAHVKFEVRPRTQPGMRPLDVIGFGMAGRMDLLRQSLRAGHPLDLLASVQENTWRGTTTLQLRARDLRLAASGPA